MTNLITLRALFSHIPIEFGQTGISAIRSADPENPTTEPNMKWIGRPLAEIWPFEIFPNVRSVVGRSSVGRRSVGPQYILLVLLTLISYTPLRYVRNVAREEQKNENMGDVYVKSPPAHPYTAIFELVCLPFQQ